MKLVNDDTGEEVSQLSELARRFPAQFVEQKDGQDFVAHSVVNQRLLSIVGPFDFQLVQILRSDIPAIPPDPNAKRRRAQRGTPALSQVVTGAVWRLTCEVDGRRTEIEEVGDTDPHNWATDGARLKDAASDAIKRAAMRLGLGLHLWAGDLYFLERQLQAQQPRSDSDGASQQHDRPATTARNLSGDPKEPAWQKA